MTHFTDAAGLLSAALIVVAAGLLVARVSAWSKPSYRIALLCIVSLATVIPINGLPVAGYVRGVVGDLSITTVVMLTWGIGSRVFQWPAVPEKQIVRLYGLIVLCGVIFYPMALGATSYDPYRLGYGSYYFLSGLFVLGLTAWLKGQLLITSGITLAVLAYSMGWYASTNLWDYLMDPLLAVYALFYLLGRTALRPLSSVFCPPTPTRLASRRLSHCAAGSYGSRRSTDRSSNS